MANFFASSAFSDATVSFGAKSQYFEHNSYPLESAAPAEYLPDLYANEAEIPDDYRSALSVEQQSTDASYGESIAWSNEANEAVEYSASSAVSGSFTGFASVSVDANVNWAVLDVSISAAAFDAAVSSRGLKDDRNLFSSAFEGDDKIFLSQYKDTFHAGSGDDVIFGFGGDDKLYGQDGNDTIDGGFGADTVAGGKGDDVYISDGNDKITEAQNEGTDLVESSASLTLSANVENLTLTGSAHSNGTGNILNNVITGNSGNNILNGTTGSDTLTGGLGNDTYKTDGGDMITENDDEGTDIVQSSAAYTLGANLENLTLTASGNISGTGNSLNNVIMGNNGNNILNGNAGSDTLNGSLGSDTLIGGSGKDVLTGGAGADTFIFQSVSDSSTDVTDADLITDFIHGTCKIDLSSIDAFAATGRNDAFVWKGTAAFNDGSHGEVRYQKYDNANTADDYTMVWIDNDGDASAEMAIRLTGLVNLTAADFIL